MLLMNYGAHKLRLVKRRRAFNWTASLRMTAMYLVKKTRCVVSLLHGHGKPTNGLSLFDTVVVNLCSGVVEAKHEVLRLAELAEQTGVGHAPALAILRAAVLERPLWRTPGNGIIFIIRVNQYLAALHLLRLSPMFLFLSSLRHAARVSIV